MAIFLSRCLPANTLAISLVKAPLPVYIQGSHFKQSESSLASVPSCLSWQFLSDSRTPFTRLVRYPGLAQFNYSED